MLPSLDALCNSDVDAIALFTQRHLHGPQAVKSLQAGKHVYSAVPVGISVKEISEIIETVKRTGLLYMTGETSYYYPSALYSRQRFNAGDFGRFVYAEAQYLHDMNNFYASFQHSGGPEWKTVAGFPPMYYATHSISLVDDFVNAWSEGSIPPCNIWNAARWCVPGIIAHESAKQGGKLLEIPDFGDPPEPCSS